MAPRCVFRVELYRVDTIRLSNVRSHTNLCNSFLLIEINYDAFEFKEKNLIQINLSEVRNTCAFRFYDILGGKQTKFCQFVRANHIKFGNIRTLGLSEVSVVCISSNEHLILFGPAARLSSLCSTHLIFIRFIFFRNSTKRT